MSSTSQAASICMRAWVAERRHAMLFGSSLVSRSLENLKGDLGMAVAAASRSRTGWTTCVSLHFTRASERQAKRCVTGASHESCGQLTAKVMRAGRSGVRFTRLRRGELHEISERFVADASTKGLRRG